MEKSLIEAVAARLDLPVVTGNAGHFAAMQQAGLNVRLENWKT